MYIYVAGHYIYSFFDVFVQHSLKKKYLLILKGQFFTSKANILRDAGEYASL